MRFSFSALLSAQRPQVGIRKQYKLTDPNREPKEITASGLSGEWKAIGFELGKGRDAGDFRCKQRAACKARSRLDSSSF